MDKETGKVIFGREVVGSNQAGSTRALATALQKAGVTFKTHNLQTIELRFPQTGETFRIFAEGLPIIKIARVRESK